MMIYPIGIQNFEKIRNNGYVYVEVERTTSRGRMDIVLKTTHYIYVMELKLDGSAEEALHQIEEKGYTTPFNLNKRKLFKIGVNLSSETRGVEEYLIKEG